MGKKRCRTKYTSKGIHSNVSKSIIKLVARQTDEAQKLMNLYNAWKKGQNPWITVENPQHGTNRPFSRVRTNDTWGDPKRRAKNAEVSENAA